MTLSTKPFAALAASAISTLLFLVTVTVPASASSALLAAPMIA